MVKRGIPAITVCSTEFEFLGRAQAQAFGYPDLPIVFIPHPFGTRTREEVRAIAEACLDDIAAVVATAMMPATVRPE